MAYSHIHSKHTVQEIEAALPPHVRETSVTVTNDADGLRVNYTNLSHSHEEMVKIVHHLEAQGIEVLE